MLYSYNFLSTSILIAALTAQNTLGVTGISESSPEFFKAQLDAIFTDIYPDAVKKGMVASKELIETIADALITYKAKNIVLDPVMVSTSGSRLIKEDAAEVLKERLMVLADVITPNIPETEVLTGMTVDSADSMEKAAIKIYEHLKTKGGNAAVLVKGGHAVHTANDCLCVDGSIVWLNGERIDNPNTHGTGCTLSSAIAANLAQGLSISSQYVWSSGPLPLPRLSPAFNAPVRYSLAAFTLSSIDNPCARLAAWRYR